MNGFFFIFQNIKNNKVFLFNFEHNSGGLNISGNQLNMHLKSMIRLGEKLPPSTARFCLCPIEIVMNEMRKLKMSADFFANTSHNICRCPEVYLKCYCILVGYNCKYGHHSATE